MKNTDKQFGNLPEDRLPYESDPIIQARDESSKQNEVIQPVEAIIRAKTSMPLSDSALSYGRFANTRNYNRQAWTGSYLLKSTLRYKWTILLIFILTAAPLLALIWTQIIPKYQARAEIRVKPIIPFLVYPTEDSGMIPLYSSFLNTQVSIIRSMTVLQRVLDQREIRETSWYKNPEKSILSKLSSKKMSPLERLRDNLSVMPRRQTEIIDVSFTCDNAKEAKLIVDCVLEQYRDYDKVKSTSNEKELYDQLTKEYDTLEKAISQIEDNIKFRLNSLGTTSPEELVASKKMNIEQLQHQLSEVQQNIEILNWDKEKVSAAIHAKNDSDSNNVTSEGKQLTQNEDSNDIDVSNQRKYYADPEWRRLNVDVMTWQYQIETSQLTDDNPDMKRLEDGLQFAKKLLHIREVQIDDQRNNMPESMVNYTGDQNLNSKEQLKNIENQIERNEKEKEIKSAKLASEQEEFNKLFKEVELYEEDTADLAHKQELFEAVRQRKEQKDMERNVPGSIEILTSAFVPSKYYNDRRIVYSIMVLCCAIGLGFGIALLRASMNQVVFASQDLPLSTRVPHLGSIPLIRLKNPLGKTLGEEIERNQVHLFESVRVIRTKLLLQLNSQNSSTLLVSSSVAGTGKSSFIKVLGKCIAKTGQKVLMVDADFYKKTLSKRFGLVDKPGIMNYINTKKLDFSGIYQTEIPNLSILPAGKLSHDKAVFEGIDNGFFGTYLEELQKRYSVILLDSSPVLPRADTVIMSHYVNGVILVERELLSRRENIINATESINSSGGNIWGVVFVSSSDFETYGNYSGYYET